MELVAACSDRPVLGRLLSAATSAEAGLTEDLWRLSEDELAVVVRLVARLQSAVDRCAVAVVAEADSRGTGSAQGWSTVDWVIGVSRGRISAQRAAQLLRVAQAVRESSDGLAMDSYAEAVLSGALDVEKADRISSFHRLARPVSDPDDLAADVRILIDGAAHRLDERGDVDRSAPVALTVPQLAVAIRVAGQHLRPLRDLETEERAARAGRALFKTDGPAGMSTYRWTLDQEGAAAVDAAVSALAHPVPGPDGSRDPRPACTRRADALLMLVQQGVARKHDTSRGKKAQVVVTIDADRLYDRARGAGLTDTGQALSPSVVRRLACDAGILPMILGSDSAPLDVGRSDRYFRGSLRRAIVHRDKGCTYPGCTAPPGWCDAHHNTWWSRGGTTSFTDGALLCPRHHTLVHDRDLSAVITATSVVWPVEPPGDPP